MAKILDKLLAEDHWDLQFDRNYDGYDFDWIYYVTVRIGLNEPVESSFIRNSGEGEETSFIESVVDKALTERCKTCKHLDTDHRCRVLPVVWWREDDYGCRKWESIPFDFEV